MRSFHLFVLVLLVGCASPPKLTGPKFTELEAVSQGFSRIYLFRPDFAEKYADESPWVSIGGSRVVQLAHQGFTSVEVRPGRQEVRVQPEGHQTELWKAAASFNAEPDKVYFVAVWIEQPGVYAPNMLFATMGGMVVPIVMGAVAGSHSSTGGRIQLVTQDDALPYLRDMRFLEPTTK